MRAQAFLGEVRHHRRGEQQDRADRALRSAEGAPFSAAVVSS
jgi:hypothetical protein